MSCGKGYSNNCVREVIRDIVAAQDRVNNNNDCCTTSCERSIEELLSPARPANNGFSTVPFILYCKGDCSPFIASGVYEDVIGGTMATFFNCIESPILRAKGFVDDSDSCVRLELLAPVNAADEVTFTRGAEVCDFFSETIGQRARNFIATGICITVDLDCFCGIQCLTPINPLPSSQFLNS